MSEESQHSEEFIKKIIQKSELEKPSSNEKKISKIISQARRDIGVRDFILLVFVRFWIVLAEITCKAIASHSKGKDSENFKLKSDRKR